VSTEKETLVTELLEVRDIKTEIRMKHSTVRAVDGVSLTIRSGETVGLVGESGCGKSITGMSIMRLLPPGGRIVSGSVRLNGQEITELSERRMQQVRGNEVAMVFQDPMTSLNPTMTVGDQVAEPAQAHRGASKREAVELAVEALAMVGMPSPRDRMSVYPHQLSGGLRQRAVIAMALVCEPKLLIADEPTTALDVTIQSQIMSLLDDLKERLNLGILLVSHDMGLIAGRADRVMVMYAGRIVEEGDTDVIFRDSRHPYSEALLESIPSITSDRRKVLYSIPGLPPDLAHVSSSCHFAPRCRYATDRCRDEDPVLVEEKKSGHSYACFYPRLESSEEKAQFVRDRAATASDVGAHFNDRSTASSSVGETTGDGDRQPLVVVDHLVKEFPVTRGVLQRQIGSVKAVSDVSFEVFRGETFGLVGESGCGKSTLGKLIVGMDKPDSGRIMFDGQEVSGFKGETMRRNRREFQLMFQDPYASLDPRMRIGSSLREPLSVQHVGSRGEQQARIKALLGDVGLPAMSLAFYPHEFSGGQRQRIGLARALMLEPNLVVADEPVSSLDVSIRSQVLNLMRQLQSERDLTYIVISHDLSVVRYLADRIGVMYLGKLVEIGSTAEVYDHPAHPYTAALLAAVPVADPTRQQGKGMHIKGELPSATSPPSGCRFRTRCPRAESLCAEVEPEPRAFGSTGHLAACHFPLETPAEPGKDAVASVS
jgi:peptide/nickel transport system ATP-binding protein